MGRREGRERARLERREAEAPTTSAARLAALAAAGDHATQRAVARHPNASPETLRALLYMATDEVLGNPALPLLLLSGEWSWSDCSAMGVYVALKSLRCPLELLAFLARPEGWRWLASVPGPMPVDVVRAALAQPAPLPVREGLLLGLARSLPQAERHARLVELGTEACLLLIRAGLRADGGLTLPDPPLSDAEQEALARLGPLAEALLVAQPHCLGAWLEAQALDPSSEWQSAAVRHPALPVRFIDASLRTSHVLYLFDLARHPRCPEATLHALLDRALPLQASEHALAERGAGDLPLSVMRRLLQTGDRSVLQTLQRRTDLPEALRAEFHLPRVR